MLQPTAFSHVGVTVPNLDAAIQWYREAFGMYVLAGPIKVVEDDTDLGMAAAAIYGVGFSSFSFAHLVWPDGSGLELFHFASPETSRRDNNFEFWKTGIYHLALTAPNFEATIARIVEAGGRQRSDAVVINAERGYSVVYCEDPWGTVIELCSHPYAQMWA
ncbi:catechol 2,3-dioxygenase-like lactoylglutathione lyase family enzyme [Arthrobacter pascens]|uniref:VOC family protein n=1 Tax=Arthrobacter pascens TaxID=1677 RepID=UPI002787CBBC|nr:VOC family protein [Arthrobacter pascens]MDQ0634329.1 catechol 2,3-dioxygenase-like lactoylglutathione lyase family enzyme [Arthrobacter pascens]